jgi:hypothetical protein
LGWGRCWSCRWSPAGSPCAQAARADAAADAADGLALRQAARADAAADAADGLALRQAARADAAADAADARRVSAQALATDDIERSLLLAAAAVGLDDSPTTRANLLSALGRSPQLIGAIRGEGDVFYRTDPRADGEVVAVEGGGYYGLDISPEGDKAAAFDDASGIALYDLESGLLLASDHPRSPLSETSARSRANPLAYSPDGRQLVVGVPGVVLAGEAAPAAPPVRLLDGDTLEESPVQLGGLPRRWRRRSTSATAATGASSRSASTATRCAARCRSRPGYRRRRWRWCGRSPHPKCRSRRSSSRRCRTRSH